MDLQQVFYIIGIIFMTLSILILIGIAILVFYIKKKIEATHHFIESRINGLTKLSLKPIQKAAGMAHALLNQPNKSSSKRK